MAQEKKVQNESFEAKLEAAKEILKTLNDPNLPLDRATSLHKDGMKLLKEASMMLEEAKLEYEEHQPKN